jgi:uncharacterized membrane protein YraQ (UPF0718 family)
MMNKISKKNGGQWIFLLIIVILYLTLSFINFNLTKEAFTYFLQLLQKIIPVFTLVFILVFLFNLFIKPQKIIKFIGESAGLKGWFISIIGGILSTGPIYVWYPMLGEFKKRGMKNSFIAAFLYNRAVKIPFIPMMIYYFGLVFTVILTFYMIIFSVINGILVEKLIKLRQKNRG